MSASKRNSLETIQIYINEPSAQLSENNANVAFAIEIPAGVILCDQ